MDSHDLHDLGTKTEKMLNIITVKLFFVKVIFYAIKMSFTNNL